MRRRGSEAWAWVSESYMCTLSVEELTPNLGLYWCARLTPTTPPHAARAPGPWSVSAAPWTDDRLRSRYFFIELFDVFRPFYLGALFAQPLVSCVPRPPRRRAREGASGGT